MLLCVCVWICCTWPQNKREGKFISVLKKSAKRTMNFEELDAFQWTSLAETKRQQRKKKKKRKFPCPLITPTCGLHHNGKDICMRPSIFVSLLPVCVCRCVTRCERRPASLFWPLLSHPIDGIRLIFYRLAQERRREKIMGAVWFHDRHTSCRSEIIPCTYQIKWTITPTHARGGRPARPYLGIR